VNVDLVSVGFIACASLSGVARVRWGGQAFGGRAWAPPTVRGAASRG